MAERVFMVVMVGRLVWYETEPLTCGVNVSEIYATPFSSYS